ncbi:hypothetical protein GCM10023196_082190 [Actinoallomurus vinaceus]|uniref:Uncharacterized protein n=1 Tax=Actinoallomurus vinaceus TaxID=1080074 RepID=A0ABP8UNS3_9ACTN
MKCAAGPVGIATAGARDAGAVLAALAALGGSALFDDEPDPQPLSTPTSNNAPTTDTTCGAPHR